MLFGDTEGILVGYFDPPRFCDMSKDFFLDVEKINIIKIIDVDYCF